MAQIKTLELDNDALLVKLEKATTEVEESITSREAIAHTHSVELEVLQERINELGTLNAQKDITDEVNISKIKQLEQCLSKTQRDAEEDRRELGAQIDELRVAGQVRCNASC